MTEPTGPFFAELESYQQIREKATHFTVIVTTSTGKVTSSPIPMASYLTVVCEVEECLSANAPLYIWDYGDRELSVVPAKDATTIVYQFINYDAVSGAYALASELAVTAALTAARK